MRLSCFIVVVACFIFSGCKREAPQQSGHSPQQARAEQATPKPEATPFVITAETKWETIEEFDFAPAKDRKTVHFKLQIPEGYDEPGDFIRVRIQTPNQPDFVLDNEDGWIAYDNKEQPSEVYSSLQKKNLIQSRYVLALPSSATESDPPLIFLRSWEYASDAERLHILGFETSGQPLLLLNEELDLAEVSDLDHDGYLEVVGYPCMSQEFGDNLQTYDPFHVYKIPHPMNAPASLSLPLTKAYNLKHYYGWAGPNCSEDYAVVLKPPSGGKPVVMKTKDAEALMSHASDKTKK